MFYLFYFNLLVQNINFHVHFWFFQKGHFKGSYEKRAHRQKTLGGLTTTLPPPSPCSGGLAGVFDETKGYRNQKTIFAMLQHLMYQEQIFFMRVRKHNFSFSRHLNFCVFEESANFEISDVFSALLYIRSYAFGCFFKILASIHMKFDHLNISASYFPASWYIYQITRNQSKAHLLILYPKLNV